MRDLSKVKCDYMEKGMTPFEFARTCAAMMATQLNAQEFLEVVAPIHMVLVRTNPGGTHECITATKGL
jgi:hypothetical protein